MAQQCSSDSSANAATLVYKNIIVLFNSEKEFVLSPESSSDRIQTDGSTTTSCSTTSTNIQFDGYRATRFLASEKYSTSSIICPPMRYDGSFTGKAQEFLVYAV